MNKEKILSLLQRKEVKDYTYVIMFFAISSFFALFAVKPALSIAFTLKKQASQLGETNTVYEQNIVKILDLQQKLEEVRSQKYLIDEAIPQTPNTTNLVDDIKKAANREGIAIKEINLGNVDLKDEGERETSQSLLINMETEADYSQVRRFVAGLIQQRRLKEITNLKIARQETFATESAALKISMEIKSFYL